MSAITQPRPIATVLQSVELFRKLDDVHLETLVGMAVSRTFRQDESIFRQGDACPGLYVVDQGLVKVFRNGPRGQQHILHLCGPNQTFAEVAVFGDFDLPASAVATCATASVLIPADRLRSELATNHGLCLQMLAGMAFWARHFVELLDDIVLRDATERVVRVLCDAPRDEDGWLRLPGRKKDLANHLNLASETFSRVLKKLREESVIEVGPNHAIRVIDAEVLLQRIDRE